MLVITRREGERVEIKSKSGELLGSILIRSARKGRASVGLEFVPDVKILRRELEE